MTITEVHFSSYEAVPVVKSTLFIPKKSLAEIIYAYQKPFWKKPMLNGFTKLWIRFAVKWIEQDIRQGQTSVLKKAIETHERSMLHDVPPLLGSSHV